MILFNICTWGLFVSPAVLLALIHIIYAQFNIITCAISVLKMTSPANVLSVQPDWTVKIKANFFCFSIFK